ncbi:MAG: hypothetical protein DMF61_18900 [Blastocatellia bacterium AA13]|nr:MAG: hypothetical protein DMF61_18900 [Blastocatellia bacterium AA13]
MVKNILMLVLATMCVSATSLARPINLQGDAKKSGDVVGVWLGSWEGDSSGKFELTITKGTDGKLAASMLTTPSDGPGFTAKFKSIEVSGNKFTGKFEDPTDENTQIGLDGTIDSSIIKGTWEVQSKQGEKMGGGVWQAKKK